MLEQNDTIVDRNNTEVALQAPGPREKYQPPPFFETRKGRLVAAWALGIFGAAIAVYGFFLLKYTHIIDQRLSAGPFPTTFGVFAAPRSIAVGDRLTRDAVAASLRQSGYSTARGNPMGWYRAAAQSIEIYPGPDSYTGAGDSTTVEFANGEVSRIYSLHDRVERQNHQLEPQLITSLSENRERRRLVRFADIPRSLVNAVVAVEDKHFFRHSGFDVPRIAKAAYVDVKTGHKGQGASTVTMQLARAFWLVPEKNWSRKFAEFFITMHLEEKLSKQQIFEYYANQIYLGRNATFSVNGFAEGARFYLGKDLPQLTVAEAALLAGLVQRPSYYNPFRYPDRARDRRNVVLGLMRQNGYLRDSEYREALASPLTLAPEQSESMDRQYFVDLMNKEMQDRFDDSEKPVRYLYTTLDSDLQSAAEEAVTVGMNVVDRQLSRKNRGSPPPDRPQVALVALDPRTGEVKALVGGRDYRASQLNRALAMRQPGSAFKPFVFAAALSTAVVGGRRIFTPSSVVSDVPTTFEFEHQTYQPGNFHGESMGSVTLRTALSHSVNVVAVRLAQQVGYRQVVDLAHRAGLNQAIKPTPSVALGAYETTPLEIAGAYTVFANRGAYVAPTTISLARGADGTVLYQHRVEQRRVLDPRVAYLMVSMMQDVLRSGTGAAARSYGFFQPAAGKTGTSRDGWFAGFTSELLCVVWVGFDDNRELNLEGSRSALPVWAEFMKRAAKLPQYRNARPFQPPPGLASAEVCSESGQRPGAYCLDVRNDVFIAGTEPRSECELHTVDTHYADRLVRRSADRSADRSTGLDVWRPILNAPVQTAKKIGRAFNPWR